MSPVTWLRTSYHKLVAVVVVFFFTLFVTTWLSVSPGAYENVRMHLPGVGAGGAGSREDLPPLIGPAQAPPAAPVPPPPPPPPISPVEKLMGVVPSEPWRSCNVSTYVVHPPQTDAELAANATRNADGNLYPPSYVPQEANVAKRAKAGFIVLARNRELEDLKGSIRDVEYRFNHKYGYPWIFLNDQPFSKEFKAGVRKLTRSEVRFGQVPHEHWSYPPYVDQVKAAKARKEMGKKGMPYGDSESYRHMCRYQSGFFFRHPLTLDLDYYWRVEPGIKLHCDIDYDPFLFMQLNNKTYGFTIAGREFIDTVPTLWETTRDFITQHPFYIPKSNADHFLFDTEQRIWNTCHFWSNFEIGDLRFWRSQRYLDYFNYLDRAGGFFYERWGDAPVHSIAAALFLENDQIHHFDDIGYTHHPWTHCPKHQDYHNSGRCDCDTSNTFDRHDFSCLAEWYRGATEKVPTHVVP